MLLLKKLFSTDRWFKFLLQLTVYVSRGLIKQNIQLKYNETIQ